MAWLLLPPSLLCAQKPNPYISVFPPGTIIHENVPYNDDADPRHLLDLYLPANAKGKTPLVVFVHGGGWVSNDKYADMGYMKKTIAEIVSSGFALASIDYRLATQAVFPALIQDCNRAASFLYDNANKYGLDRSHALCRNGFSAGGHPALRPASAYDKKTGGLVGEVALPRNATAAPMTYLMNGKQYIVVATGGANLPAELIALRLP